MCYNAYRKGLKMKKSTKKPEMIEKSKFYALLMVTAVLAAVIVFLICYMFLYYSILSAQRDWIERPPPKGQVRGSNPPDDAT